MLIKVAKSIEDKSRLSEDRLPDLTDIVGDEDKAKEIIEAAKASTVQDFSLVALDIVQLFAQRLAGISEYRKGIYDFLGTKMNDSLIGVVVGAPLISHAGSLTDLAKCPSSTQIWTDIPFSFYWSSICAEQGTNGSLSHKQVFHCFSH
ncbi:hypothetical protein ACE6H2_016221 [Prunus campanulata]